MDFFIKCFLGACAVLLAVSLFLYFDDFFNALVGGVSYLISPEGDKIFFHYYLLS